MLSSDQTIALVLCSLTASDAKVYRRISLNCFLFREQLDVSSELQKENDQFVSLLSTYMTFNRNYFTTRDTTIVPNLRNEILRRKKSINVLRSAMLRTPSATI